MGEAKRRRALGQTEVYHHTSALYSSLILMSSVIQVEGSPQKHPVLHPYLDVEVMGSDVRLRRALKDFLPLVWLTTEISIPKCLINLKLCLRDKKTGEIVGKQDCDRAMEEAFSLGRLAFGFNIKDIPVIPWPDHYGFRTCEGRQLNETAREYGDSPTRWFVSEKPIDMTLVSSIWTPRKNQKYRLERNDQCLRDTKAVVALCKEREGVFIAPAWLSEKDARALANKLGVPAVDPSAL